VPETEKAAYSTLKSKYDGYLRRMTELPESQLKIDWALYKKQVPIPGMVDKFQKEYEALKVPYPTDNYSSSLDALEAEASAHVKKFIEESNQRISELQDEAATLKAMLPFDQMTLEDFAEAYPDVAINIDKPTIWPHTEDMQPDDRNVATPMPKPDEH